MAEGFGAEEDTVSMLRGQTEPETCNLNGWGVTTTLRGHEQWSDGRGVWTTIRITAIGESAILARCVRHELTDPSGAVIGDRICHDRESIWTLDAREWTQVTSPVEGDS